MVENYDISIIGGGPAGSTAAIYFARLGYRVSVFERQKFPRETLCGEFLSHEVTSILKELNLFDDFLTHNPNEINSFRFIDKTGNSTSTKLNFQAYGLRRSVFDNFLLTQAGAEGAAVFQHQEVKSIERIKDELFRLQVKDDKGNLNLIDSKIVIAAYGKKNILDKVLNRKFVELKSNLNGIKFHVECEHFNSFPKDEIQIVSSKNIYCGFNKVDNNKITVCSLIDNSNNSMHPNELLKNLILKNDHLKNYVSNTFTKILDNSKIYGTGNIYFGKREKVNNGIFMLGDAAGIITPLAGDGIGMAMQSAKLLSEILDNGFKKKLGRKIIENNYKIEWENLFDDRVRNARLIQKIILSKRGNFIGRTVIKIYPNVIRKLINITRY